LFVIVTTCWRCVLILGLLVASFLSPHVVTFFPAFIMPTYDYECDACHHKWELFQSIKAEPEKTCPACHKKKARRLIGTGAGLLFKGSGFYITDYRSKSYSEAAKADRSHSDTASPQSETSAKSDSGSSKSSGASDAKSKS
jgi:putative FmdB family regulatory protein